MGHGEVDDTRQVLKLEQPALNTTRNLVREMNDYDLVFHVGDLSYADGYEAIVSWIAFFGGWGLVFSLCVVIVGRVLWSSEAVNAEVTIYG